MWLDCWAVCNRTEVDYRTYFNHIHHNPVKHGYGRQMGNWPFSNYRHSLEHKGAERLMDAFRQYPLVDLTDSSDDLLLNERARQTNKKPAKASDPEPTGVEALAGERDELPQRTTTHPPPPRSPPSHSDRHGLRSKPVMSFGIEA